jgi:hypothetical protein
MTGICERHLSLVDACHIMGMVHLYKYWTVVLVTLTVKGSTIIYLLIVSDILSFCHGFLYLTSREMTYVCGQAVSFGTSCG